MQDADQQFNVALDEALLALSKRSPTSNATKVMKKLKSLIMNTWTLKCNEIRFLFESCPVKFQPWPMRVPLKFPFTVTLYPLVSQYVY